MRLRWRSSCASGTTRSSRRCAGSASRSSARSTASPRAPVLPRLVGPAKAAELALIGEPLSAVDAERFGLVARVVPGDARPAEARAVATRLAGLAPIALAQTKRALERSWSTGLEAALEDEAYRQGIAGATADHAEGLAAFLEKRPPRFRGE